MKRLPPPYKFNATIRKRPRSSHSHLVDDGSDDDGGVFGYASDSEPDVATLPSRFPNSSRLPPPSSRFRDHKMPNEQIATTGKGSPPAAQPVGEDPLDAFMNNLDCSSNAKRRQNHHNRPPSTPSDEDDTPLLDSTPQLVPSTSSRNRREEDAIEEARRADEERRFLTLPTVDHSKIQYRTIQKALYTPLARHQALSVDALKNRASAAGVSVSGSGADTVCVIETFTDVALALPRALLGSILRDYTNPTAVQRAVLPAALAGNDVLATAETGSGKTLAFIVPLVAHARAQGRDSGSPRALVLAPTRELAAQIARVARSFDNGVALVAGGVDKYTQIQMVRAARNLLVATPGRLIDLVKMRAVGLKSISAIALDEADRMLDMGFEGQVRAILQGIRPDAQKLMLSATLPATVRSLAEEFLYDPVIIVPTRALDATAPARAATVPLVCETVTEHYVALQTSMDRWKWLSSHLSTLLDKGSVILFCRSRGACAALANQVRSFEPVACVHGETDAADRTALLAMFRRREVRVLVSTDLAARGLDISAVNVVVNYECAKDWEWHVHRAGRTGRAGRSGDVYTLLIGDAPADMAFALKARDALRKGGVDVPKEISDIITSGGRVKRSSGASGMRHKS